ncbi:MAG: hypothetical protein AAF745_09480, partial [Planctomycetota bacterium]
MPIPIRPIRATTDEDYEIQLTDDGSRTLIHQPSGVAYHSGCGARTECDHVYVRNGGLIERAE